MSATQNMIPIHRGFREHLIPEKMKSWISVILIESLQRLMTSLAHFNQAIMEFWVRAPFRSCDVSATRIVPVCLQQRARHICCSSHADWCRNNTFQLSHYGVRGAGPIPKLRRSPGINVPSNATFGAMASAPHSRSSDTHLPALYWGGGSPIRVLWAERLEKPVITAQTGCECDDIAVLAIYSQMTPEGLLQTTAALFAEIWKSAPALNLDGIHGARKALRWYDPDNQQHNLAPWSAVRLKVLSLGSNRTRGFGIVASVPLLRWGPEFYLARSKLNHDCSPNAESTPLSTTAAGSPRKNHEDRERQGN
ncbi:hypothetical protein B0H14DRAFT_2624947 [Mycena olivaceomarginata]|nr:hypothetical protein B0H14DRAFT_2624947 [Mycena olivaceomarginata]